MDTEESEEGFTNSTNGNDQGSQTPERTMTENQFNAFQEELKENSAESTTTDPDKTEKTKKMWQYFVSTMRERHQKGLEKFLSEQPHLAEDQNSEYDQAKLLWEKYLTYANTSQTEQTHVDGEGVTESVKVENRVVFTEAVVDKPLEPGQRLQYMTGETSPAWKKLTEHLDALREGRAEPFYTLVAPSLPRDTWRDPNEEAIVRRQGIEEGHFRNSRGRKAVYSRPVMPQIDGIYPVQAGQEWLQNLRAQQTVPLYPQSQPAYSQRHFQEGYGQRSHGNRFDAFQYQRQGQYVPQTGPAQQYDGGYYQPRYGRGQPRYVRSQYPQRHGLQNSVTDTYSEQRSYAPNVRQYWMPQPVSNYNASYRPEPRYNRYEYPQPSTQTYRSQRPRISFTEPPSAQVENYQPTEQSYRSYQQRPSPSTRSQSSSSSTGFSKSFDAMSGLFRPSATEQFMASGRTDGQWKSGASAGDGFSQRKTAESEWQSFSQPMSQGSAPTLTAEEDCYRVSAAGQGTTGTWEPAQHSNINYSQLSYSQNNQQDQGSAYAQ